MECTDARTIDRLAQKADEGNGTDAILVRANEVAGYLVSGISGKRPGYRGPFQLSPVNTTLPPTPSHQYALTRAIR